MLALVGNHFPNPGPKDRSASLYVNSPTLKNPAKARVNAAYKTRLS